MNPYKVVQDFEASIGEYTGAPYVVAVNSCTMALFLCLKALSSRFGKVGTVEIPRRTYVSVPMSILHAGGRVSFRNDEWRGSYRLSPYPIYDSARRFTRGMYVRGNFIRVSFHASKILGIEQGGAILHDDVEADKWLRKARFDGRTEGVAPKDDTFDMLGWHCYMNPSTAAQGLLKIYSLPYDNSDLPNDDYPDLSTMEIFK